jgi:competence/damage-inducible protein CinA-like protein
MRPLRTAALIAVGSELLRPGRSDANGDWLTERLGRLGIEVVARTIVGDDAARTATVIVAALRAGDLVILTGGLGPTEDDRTREALARALGRPLERDAEREERLRAMFESRGRTFRPMQARQTEKPRGAEWVDNPLGTAPGVLCRRAGRLVIALPGVPAEMRRMFEDSVAPLASARAMGALARRALKIGGRLEASVDEQLRDLYGTRGVDVTILAGHEGIELQLAAHGADAEHARLALDALEREIADRLGDDLYGKDDETLPVAVGRALTAAGLSVATAESCTAGLLAAALTEVPGSSAWFRGGVVPYADDLKPVLADVPVEVVARSGAVSEDVARALAEGVRRRTGASLGVGITGIAGPGGGSADKPVGLVHVAIAGPARTDHWRLLHVGDRALIRRRSVSFALDRLRRRASEREAG